MLRCGAGVARWAHNPEVVGSNPIIATKTVGVDDKLYAIDSDDKSVFKT